MLLRRYHPEPEPDEPEPDTVTDAPQAKPAGRTRSKAKE